MLTPVGFKDNVPDAVATMAEKFACHPGSSPNENVDLFFTTGPASVADYRLFTDDEHGGSDPAGREERYEVGNGYRRVLMVA